jgi:hypothetical protein
MQRVDRVTVIGLGMLLMPLLTMWHEIGGHAAACVVTGGRVKAIGAFYVDCDGPTQVADWIVAGARVGMNVLLACLAFALWRRVRGDLGRLVAYLVWLSEAFVASGYFVFSGVTGFGDLGVGPDGSFAGVPYPLAVRVAELAVGACTYVWLVRLGIRSLSAMIGTGPATIRARRGVAHVYYATAGLCAVVVGLLNPLGLVITIMSAAASSFGGLAGFISIGFAPGRGDRPRDFLVERSWAVFAAGGATLLGFALVLGRSVQF